MFLSSSNSYLLFCIVIVIQITSLDIGFSATQIYSFCFMQLFFFYFKLCRRKKELQIMHLCCFILIYVFTYGIELLSGVLSFLSEGLFAGQVYWYWILCFCLSWNILISYFWRTALLDMRILGWQTYSFSTLNMLSYCLLASMVSHEKSTVNLIEKPLFVMSHFSLADFKTYLFVFWQVDHDVSRCGSLILSYVEFVEFMSM